MSPTSLFDLKGRTALVTGASGWLGRPIAMALSQAGANVFANGRDASRLSELVATARDEGLLINPLPFDVTDTAAAREGLAEIERAAGAVDVLINNAYSSTLVDVNDAEEAAFADAYEINVVAAYRLIRDGLPLLRRAAQERGSASIVNMASMYALVSPDPRVYDEVPPNPPFYGASKAGLVQLTRYLACWLGRESIRSNAVAPGPFPRRSVQHRHPAFAESLRERVPLRRLGRPEDVCGIIVFLASSASDFVNGAVIPVDGGWTAW